MATTRPSGSSRNQAGPKALADYSGGTAPPGVSLLADAESVIDSQGPTLFVEGVALLADAALTTDSRSPALFPDHLLSAALPDPSDLAEDTAGISPAPPDPSGSAEGSAGIAPALLYLNDLAEESMGLAPALPNPNDLAEDSAGIASALPNPSENTEDSTGATQPMPGAPVHCKSAAARPRPRPPSGRGRTLRGPEVVAQVPPFGTIPSGPLWGPEVVAQALPFETIPSEPLREHFTEWLVRSLTRAFQQPGLAEGEVRRTGSVQAAPGAVPGSEPQRPREPEGTAAVSRLEAGPLTESARTPTDPIAQRRRKSADAAESSAAESSAAESSARPAALTAAPTTPPETDVPAIHPRPQFVRQGDPTVWVTKSFLRSRGWTDTAVRDFLPEHEGLKPNPRFAAGAPMRVWRPETVAAAEADPEWRAWLERSLRRRRTTLEALSASADEDFRARFGAAAKAIEACAECPAEVSANRVAPAHGSTGRRDRTRRGCGLVTTAPGRTGHADPGPGLRGPQGGNRREGGDASGR